MAMFYLPGSLSYGLVYFVLIVVKSQHCFIDLLHQYGEIPQDEAISVRKFKVFELNFRCGTSHQFTENMGK